MDFYFIDFQGGMPGSANFRDCGVLESLVKKHVENGRLYAAVCAAPAVALGSWGLLKGLKVRFDHNFAFYVVDGSLIWLLCFCSSKLLC